jgi:prevent-host-death family protein
LACAPRFVRPDSRRYFVNAAGEVAYEALKRFVVRLRVDVKTESQIVLDDDEGLQIILRPSPPAACGKIRRGRGEVARMMGLMTLHNVEPKAEVGVRELHDQLSRYLHHVSSGAEVVVTVRGRRVARLSGVGAADPLADLRARGLVLDPQHSRRPMAGHVRLAAVGSVSDLVSEQRR